MKYAILFTVLLAGCSSLPTFQYCEKVEYKREGNIILVNAECRAPVGNPIKLPGM